MKPLLLLSMLWVLTSFHVKKDQGKKSKQLPVIIKCNVDNIPSNDGHTLIADYLAAKKLKVTTWDDITQLALEHTRKNVPKTKEEVEKMMKLTADQQMDRRMNAIPVLANEFVLNLLQKKATTDTIYIRLGDAPRNKATQYKTLTVYNHKALSQQDFIYAAIDTCILLKLFR